MRFHPLLACILLAYAVLGLLFLPGCSGSGNDDRSDSGGSYVVTDLGVPAGYFGSAAVAVNESGQAAGNTLDGPGAEGQPHQALFFSRGRSVNLPPARASSATDISRAGVVVGSSITSSFTLGQALLWKDGIPTELGALPPPSSSYPVYSDAHAINDAGQIVGVSNGHAFLYENGKMTDLGALGGRAATGQDINNTELILAVRTLANLDHEAVLVRNGQPTRTIFRSRFPSSEARRIDDSGQVVGSLETSSGGADGQTVVHAFLWTDSAMRDLGTLGGSSSFGYGLNDNGDAVGESRINKDSSSETHAFLFRDGRMIDLNRLLPDNSGWVLQRAFSITNNGLIAGVGIRSGQQRAFLLRPR